MTYDSKWIPMPEMVDPGRDAASPAGAEAVARLIYEGMGYDYNARTINARGEPYGKWGVAVRIAEAIARHATPSTDAVRRQAREEALEEAARIAGPSGARPCDCDRCDCKNVGDHEAVVRWDEQAATAAAIRALNLSTPPAGADEGGKNGG